MLCLPISLEISLNKILLYEPKPKQSFSNPILISFLASFISLIFPPYEIGRNDSLDIFSKFHNLYSIHYVRYPINKFHHTFYH